jgi:hypothetical protein
MKSVLGIAASCVLLFGCDTGQSEPPGEHSAAREQNMRRMRAEFRALLKDREPRGPKCGTCNIRRNEAYKACKLKGYSDRECQEFAFDIYVDCRKTIDCT